MRLVRSIKVAACVILALTCTVCYARQTQTVAEDSAYARVAIGRADKIVKTLAIQSDEKALRVREIIAGQYQHLKRTHDARDIRIVAAQSAFAADKQLLQTQTDAIEKLIEASIDSLHIVYLSRLSAELTPEQIEKVKDGMTYNVLPITYKGYLDMLPNLTSAEQQQILLYLTEAREHAMDAGSSEKKHWWFGKYKGRINNYLSAAGYDMKKAGEDWEKRRKASGGK
jgi:hypothetical protein